MATKAPDDFDVARLREAIRITYERVAREPEGAFHFHRGRAYAGARGRRRCRAIRQALM